ncbi:peptide deformylase, partial [Striga asiatica]
MMGKQEKEPSIAQDTDLMCLDNLVPIPVQLATKRIISDLNQSGERKKMALKKPVIIDKKKSDFCIQVCFLYPGSSTKLWGTSIRTFSNLRIQTQTVAAWQASTE